jgi:hypothetical protein
MADPQLDNPAGRLYQLLERIQEISRPGQMIQNFMETNGLTGAELPDPWVHRRAVLAVLSPDNSVSSAKLAQLIALALSLPDETVAEVKMLGGIISADLITGWSEPISQGLEGFFYRSISFSELLSLPDESDMRYIALCSDLLHRHRSEVEITQEKLLEIRQEISELLREVEEDLTFDAELKALLIPHFLEMLEAIDSLPTWGTARLRTAVAETVGDLAVHWQVVTSKSGNSPDTWAKVTSLLAAVSAIFSFGTAAFQAIEAFAAPALPPAQVQIINESPGSVIRLPPSVPVNTSSAAATTAAQPAEPGT